MIMKSEENKKRERKAKQKRPIYDDVTYTFKNEFLTLTTQVKSDYFEHVSKNKCCAN